VSEHDGGCHCGALGLRFSATAPVGEWSVRACTCSFCRIHAPRYASDPRGRLELTVHDRSALRTYRFGTETADFVLCGRCGAFLCAVGDSPRGRVAVVNVNCLRGVTVATATAVALEAEALEERLARRARRWTPFEQRDAAPGNEP
jgi:hypothetical protein